MSNASIFDRLKWLRDQYSYIPTNSESQFSTLNKIKLYQTVTGNYDANPSELSIRTNLERLMVKVRVDGSRRLTASEVYILNTLYQFILQHRKKHGHKQFSYQTK